MKYTLAPLAVIAATGLVTPAYAADDQQDTIRQLEQRIQQLEESLNGRMEMMADAIDAQQQTSSHSNIHFGGYGELNYHNLSVDGTDDKQLDFRRWVLFVGYDFSDRVHFHSEFEVEHTVVPGSDGEGAVELEQAFLQVDLSDTQQVKTGIQLVPVGIVNETHEPTTYYGVERPVLETTIVPTTWYVGGIMYSQQFSSGLSYDVMLSEGMKTDDPSTDSDADPFDLKAGKQKTSNADAFDLATTVRVRYTGVSGLELAAYAQYQPDLDQSAVESYADSATLLGAHLVYQLNDVTLKGMYARWDLAGDDAKEAGKQVQDGGQLEVSWKALPSVGVFARQTAWSQEEGVDKIQTNAGVNYYPVDQVVFKFDYQLQNEAAGNTDGFYLGMGYHF
ncbi:MULTISPECIES: porin [unclassified Oceanobacter]|uniref:porin n=1 Tax=unclassified Oceanobacter TaxID=2620260 RepID=UPI0026E3F104|nr:MULTISPECIES: porin [unclassified Oceanobacter]MDO6681893.1 porin [Oceanobacter sp. 5_MG-2023]MDP2505255.1 porin [Oceanobacter sp. 3_MG-2023]MDP2549271.1 porin [Oceanobacter sp. 4_MG-2023]MDP2607920.1 porin [Oceanobacter sp. 1_MG-2023]MDP2611418.1 porin [Oceanobacter sp. 2_MG-2023]